MIDGLILVVFVLNEWFNFKIVLCELCGKNGWLANNYFITFGQQ